MSTIEARTAPRFVVPNDGRAETAGGTPVLPGARLEDGSPSGWQLMQEREPQAARADGSMHEPASKSKDGGRAECGGISPRTLSRHPLSFPESFLPSSRPRPRPPGRLSGWLRRFFL